MRNLAGEPGYATLVDQLGDLLMLELTKQEDPRATGKGEIFESYPRYSSMRPNLGGFAERGAYNPAFQHP